MARGEGEGEGRGARVQRTVFAVRFLLDCFATLWFFVQIPCTPGGLRQPKLLILFPPPPWRGRVGERGLNGCLSGRLDVRSNEAPETVMKFPYGLSDFGTLIQEGYWYQDRTAWACSPAGR